MGAEADAICGAPYGERSGERVNKRNGYRVQEWDTRAGTVELAIPKLRAGSYFPDWLLERHRRAESALISVVATCYLLGVSTPPQRGRVAGGMHYKSLNRVHDEAIAGARLWSRSADHCFQGIEPALGEVESDMAH